MADLTLCNILYKLFKKKKKAKADEQLKQLKKRGG